MKEPERFEELVRTAFHEIDPVTHVPREEIWERIQAARRSARPARRAARQYLGWGAGLAAMLVLGIGLGRLTMLQKAEPVSARSARLNAGGASSASDRAPAAYRLAALQHLSRSEMLLTSVTSGTVDPQVVGWARELLTSTRLLLDSPAGAEPRMAKLLEDLELLLTQLANTTVPSKPSELDLIRQGIDEMDVLPRVRASLPATRAVGT